MILFEKSHSGKKQYFYGQSDKNLQFCEHIHNSYECVCVKSGKLICMVNSRPVTLTAGSALLILPNQIHSYATPKFSESFLCIFSADLISVFDNDVSGKVIAEPVFDYSSDKLAKISESGTKYEKIAALYELCSAAATSGFVKEDSRPPELEAKLLYYIQENYDKDISLKQVAAQFGYNYTYLSKLFNAIFSMGFNTFVNNYRLEAACCMLKSTDESVTRICSVCGFTSIRNFNIAFKNKYGISPTEFREKIAD